MRRISKEEHLCVAIMVDTKGPEIRTGMTDGHKKVMLETGASVVVTTDEVEGTAERLGAGAILCPTHSGRSARLMSVFRPQLPIFATSPSWDTIRRTNFYWGVWGIKTTEQGGLVNTCYNALTVARDEGFVNTGDIVIITAGDPQTSPRQGDYTTSTNMCMVA